MLIATRIIILSLVLSVYMVWAFRGVEYDPQEAVSALLGFVGSFLVLTAVAVPIYRMTRGKAGGNVAVFAFRCWLVTAAVVTLVWLVYFSRDTAAAGFFRDNIVVGALALIAVIGGANFALTQCLAYLAPKRS